VPSEKHGRLGGFRESWSGGNASDPEEIPGPGTRGYIPGYTQVRTGNSRETLSVREREGRVKRRAKIFRNPTLAREEKSELGRRIYPVRMVDIVWEFQVRAGAEEVFEFHYSGSGTWAILFGRSPAYHGTTLLRELEGTRRYLTLDRWDSHKEFVRFRSEFQDQYAATDKECDALTEMERLVGVFEVV